MGQKVHPTGIRLGIVKDWNSTWYADSKHYADLLNNDLEVRVSEKEAGRCLGQSHSDQPSARNAHITIHTARPGVVIGKKGEDIDKLRAEVSARMGIPVHISIEEIRKPELDAQLVAEGIAQQLERRIMFRRAMKRAVQNHDAGRCRRRSGEHRRSSERRRDRALGVVSRGSGAAAHACVRTSTTALPRREPPTAFSA
jgi:small subunit ribosomal protein S3